MLSDGLLCLSSLKAKQKTTVYFRLKVKNCGSTRARTQGLSLTVQTLYHWATEPPGHITNNFSP